MMDRHELPPLVCAVYDADVPKLGVLRCAVQGSPPWTHCEGLPLSWKRTGRCMEPHDPEWISFYSNAAARREAVVTGRGRTIQPTHKKTAFTQYRMASARGAAATAGRR